MPSTTLPRNYERLQARVSALETLQRVARDLAAELNLETLLKKILGAAMDVSQSTAGTLFLHDPDTNELVFKVVVGGGEEILKETRIPAGRGIAGKCFSEQRAIIVDDAEADPRFFSAPAVSVGLAIRQLIAVPLVVQGNAIGVLEVMNKESDEPYSAEEVELLMAFAAHSAVAMENARLYGQVLQDRDRILAVETAVRNDLARDLHDGPAQMLSVLIMQFRLLKELGKRDPNAILPELLEMEAVASKAMFQTRNILFDLRPVILEQRGIGPALEQYAARLRMTEQFRVTLNTERLKTRLDLKREGAIFSIVQEAVNNVKKHANARSLEIHGFEDEDYLTLVIHDDGKGFDLGRAKEEIGERGSYGLLSMRERADAANADLVIESTPNKGTTVTLQVPIKGEKQTS